VEKIIPCAKELLKILAQVRRNVALKPFGFLQYWNPSPKGTSSSMDRFECRNFALVSYVPEPLQSTLKRLRTLFPQGVYPEPHLTLLPPRRLRVSLDQASTVARSVLSQFESFRVELVQVNTFTETNTIYLSAADSNSQIYDIHQALNSGDLADRERFPFRPHLTLGGPLSDVVLPDIRGQADQLWQSVDGSREFSVDEVVALGADCGDDPPCWHRLWTFNLSSRRWKTARAGVVAAGPD
jgi:2'-5' RNA ligase